MTTVEKVKEAESRIRLTMAGDLDILACPFCGEQNSADTTVMLCCLPLADMVNAICDHVELKGQLKQIERVIDRLSSNAYEVPTGPRLIIQ